MTTRKCNQCKHFKRHYSPSLHTYVTTCKAPKPVKIGCVGSYERREEMTINFTYEEAELLSQCLSAYFYNIEGTPETVVSCAKKLQKAVEESTNESRTTKNSNT